MSHIHTKPSEHDFTASAFIIRTDKNEPKIMLHKHKKLGIYLQFGGHIELNETPWQAIIRELREESGYDISQLKLLQPKHSLRRLTGSTVHPSPVVIDTHKFSEESDHYHTDSVYAFTTDQDPKYKRAKGEATSIKSFSLREVKALKNETIKDIPELCDYVLNEVLKSWEIVDPSEFSH